MSTFEEIGRGLLDSMFGDKETVVTTSVSKLFTGRAVPNTVKASLLEATISGVSVSTTLAHNLTNHPGLQAYRRYKEGGYYDPTKLRPLGLTYSSSALAQVSQEITDLTGLRYVPSHPADSPPDSEEVLSYTVNPTIRLATFSPAFYAIKVLSENHGLGKYSFSSSVVPNPLQPDRSGKVTAVTVHLARDAEIKMPEDVGYQEQNIARTVADTDYTYIISPDGLNQVVVDVEMVDGQEQIIIPLPENQLSTLQFLVSYEYTHAGVDPISPPAYSSFSDSTIYSSNRGYLIIDPEDVTGGGLPTLLEYLTAPGAALGSVGPTMQIVRKGSRHIDFDGGYTKDIKLPIEEITDLLLEGDGSENIWQAMVTQCIPINSTESYDLEYLWRFWERAFNFQNPNDYWDGTAAGENNNTDWSILSDKEPITIQGTRQFLEKARYGWVIQETSQFKTTPTYNYTLSHSGIVRLVRYGKVGSGAIGNLESEQGATIFDKALLSGDAGDLSHYTERTSFGYTYRKQITESTYEELHVFDPKVTWVSKDGESTAYRADGADSLIIPLDYDLLYGMSPLELEKILYSSWHLVVNAAKTDTIYLWQTESFIENVEKFGILLTIISGMNSIYLAVVAAISTSLTAAAIEVVKVLLKQIIIKEAAEFVIDELGEKYTLVLILAAALYAGSGRPDYATNIIEEALADNLLAITNALLNGLNTNTQEKHEALLKEVEEFNSEAEVLLNALKEKEELLESESTKLLSSEHYMYALDSQNTKKIETPTAFFQRTVHTPNPGIYAMELVENFVDISLTLPNTTIT